MLNNLCISPYCTLKYEQKTTYMYLTHEYTLCKASDKV